MPERFSPAVAALAALAIGCASDVPHLPSVSAAVHRDSVALWQASRWSAVFGPGGWATLLGLWWIEPGKTSIGSAPDNTIVLPANRSPRNLGTVWLGSDSAYFVAAAGATVYADTVRNPVTAVRLHPDYELRSTVLRSGSLIIQFLVREDRGVHRRAIRIKDTLSASRTAPPLRYFPTDIRWRVQARYVPVAGADSLNIIGVLGTETRMAHPGDLRFTIGGKRYALMVIREPEDHSKNLFVMFTDSTNRKETYPATRYVWVPAPDSLGRTVIDFNKAYNPPCAFTRFATCPFPPKGNHLPLYVTAGEWNPHYEEVATHSP